MRRQMSTSNHDEVGRLARWGGGSYRKEGSLLA
jgi:hypothetical protein